MDEWRMDACKRADGLTKLGYTSAAKAKQALRRTKQRTNQGNKGPLRLRPYRCPNCGLYHLGHTRPELGRNQGLEDE